LKVVDVKVAETAVPKGRMPLGSKSHAIVYEAGAIRRGATGLRRLVSEEIMAVARRC
jgi:hypothetical protein